MHYCTAVKSGLGIIWAVLIPGGLDSRLSEIGVVMTTPELGGQWSVKNVVRGFSCMFLSYIGKYVTSPEKHILRPSL